MGHNADEQSEVDSDAASITSSQADSDTASLHSSVESDKVDKQPSAVWNPTEPSIAPELRSEQVLIIANDDAAKSSGFGKMPSLEAAGARDSIDAKPVLISTPSDDTGVQKDAASFLQARGSLTHLERRRFIARNARNASFSEKDSREPMSARKDSQSDVTEDITRDHQNQNEGRQTHQVRASSQSDEPLKASQLARQNPPAPSVLTTPAQAGRSWRTVAELRGHDHPVQCIAFSLNGRLIASGCWFDTIKVWDATTAAEVTSFGKDSGNINFLTFSPGDHFVISVSRSDVIQMWDVKTGVKIREFTGHQCSIHSLAVFENRTIAAGSRDGTIITWNVQTEKQEGISKENSISSGISFIRMSPDGGLLNPGSPENFVNVWNLIGGAHFQRPDSHSHNYIALSTDGAMLASGCVSGKLRLWDVKTGRLLRTFERRYINGVVSLAFSQTGDLLASGHLGGDIYIWDVKTGAVLRTYQGHTETVRSLTFSPDLTMLASGSDDKSVLLWELPPPGEGQVDALAEEGRGKPM